LAVVCVCPQFCQSVIKITIYFCIQKMSGDGNSGNGQPVRRMDELLRFAVQGTGTGDPSSDGQPGMVMDSQRQEWLNNALQAYSVDVVQEMLEGIARIKTSLAKLESGCPSGERQETVDSALTAADCLLERLEDLDFAADFEKIGGFTILRPLLNSPYPQLQVKGAALVGELVQNHDSCQKAAMEHGLLDVLVKLLDSSNGPVRVKSLYAVSCLIRNNEAAQEVFVNKLDGFSALMRLMQDDSPGDENLKLRTKTSFLLSCLVGKSEGFKTILLNMGFVEQLVGLLHYPHDLSHEHVLSTLLGFLSDCPPALEVASGQRLGFKELLQDRLALVKNKPEFLEEEQYCHNLLNLIESCTVRNVLTVDR